MQYLELCQFEHINWLITLSVITLSSFHCSSNKILHLALLKKLESLGWVMLFKIFLVCPIYSLSFHWNELPSITYTGPVYSRLWTNDLLNMSLLQGPLQFRLKLLSYLDIFLYIYKNFYYVLDIQYQISSSICCQCSGSQLWMGYFWRISEYFIDNTKA